MFFRQPDRDLRNGDTPLVPLNAIVFVNHYIYYMFYRKSLNHKLNDLFVDESEKEPENKKLRSSVHLLDKLVTKEKLTCLVVNLYPGNKGYSLMLKGKNDSETIKLPYEESDLLDYLDTEELPPILVDLLERSQANVFYNGCVIAEVRDFRRTANSKTYESHHVLLRPTAQLLMTSLWYLDENGINIDDGGFELPEVLKSVELY
uniref:Spt20-like SEP domain-containing protein n=1 Tax=Branchiostoma floridae TaxID=7739 RepID=C3XXU2_BRAFL|eukprot:XP_002611542.1 hypothetical protein BRAFLDRAFT_63819 [Branchiostoma floridae]